MAEQVVNAPMRARVIKYHEEVGAQVAENQKVCDIEALKMEISVFSPVAGTITEIHTAAGAHVDAEAPLFTIET